MAGSGFPSVPVHLSQLLSDSSVELVSAVLDESPATLAMRVRADDRVSADDARRVRTAARRFATGMPLAYAVGTAAFRHLLLAVDERVLIPRPETELLVDHVLRLTAGRSGGTAIDVGTGSGALALALAQEGDFARVIATDISTDALAVARSNAERCHDQLRAPVEFRHGSDLGPCRELEPRATIIVSNPPYIRYAEAETLPALVRNWEPPTALFAPQDGQARYQALLGEAPGVLEPGGWLVLECDSTRAHETLALAKARSEYSEVELHEDLTGRPRVLLARLTGADSAHSASLR
jgi:release factor glutamine methyltransferase